MAPLVRNCVPGRVLNASVSGIEQYLEKRKTRYEIEIINKIEIFYLLLVMALTKTEIINTIEVSLGHNARLQEVKTI